MQNSSEWGRKKVKLLAKIVKILCISSFLTQIKVHLSVCYFEKLWVEAASSLEDCFSVIMAADTQYPWTEPLYPGNNEKLSEQWIRNYFTSMSKLKHQTSSCPLKAVIINGDLTAFGHKSELVMFRSLLEEAKSMLNVPIYLGLGNHDYANNDNVEQNQYCIILENIMDDNMLSRKNPHHILKRIKPENLLKKNNVILKENQDVKDVSNITKEAIGLNTTYYSRFDIGKVRFIQLHNYPTYKVSFQGSLYDIPLDICGPSVYCKFNITSSLDWLVQQLKRACSQGKSIIVCFHDPIQHYKLNNESLRFKNLINMFNVAGLFVGHLHSAVGKYQNEPTVYGNVPVFASGSAIYGQYLLEDLLQCVENMMDMLRLHEI
uniref:Calcineurin-like phosphoesterase domain-containing protein n=1 Tax=Romanomermis culicivorax TaxID=13658 RepID=A0A915K3P0_ROMCU